MNNQNAKNALNDCRLELENIGLLILSSGSLSSTSRYLTKYALIRICGTLEKCYKTIIADYYDRFSPQMQRFIRKNVREANLNATYDNIAKALDAFDDGKCQHFKTSFKTDGEYGRSTSAMTDLNKARNKVAHGDNTTMSFIDIKFKFFHSIKILQYLDKELV